MSSGPFLVVGFGPFEGVEDNPSRRLALGLDGLRVGGRSVVGQEMPVEYDVCVEHTARLVEQHQPALVLGIGVAVGRSRPEVERYGRRQRELSRPDVAGQLRVSGSARSDELREATGQVEAFAAALGAAVSEDAGQYVCNAWLYDALGRLGARCPTLFLHVPPGGVDPHRLLAALPSALVGSVSGARLG